MSRPAVIRGRIGDRWRKRVWNDLHRECHGGLYQYRMMRVLPDGRHVEVSAIFTQQSTRLERAIVLRDKRRQLGEAVKAAKAGEL